MLKGKDYESLDEAFPFLASFINLSTEYEKKAPMTRVHTSYSEIGADMVRDMEQCAWGKEDQGSPERRVKAVQVMLEEAFNKHYVSTLHALKCHLLDHMVEVRQLFRTLCV